MLGKNAPRPIWLFPFRCFVTPNTQQIYMDSIITRMCGKGRKTMTSVRLFGIVREILNRHRLLDRYSEDVSLMLGNCVSAEESDSAVGWFRSIQTQEKSGDDAYKNLLRKIYSGQYKIISFNIFDTLVVRPFVPPSDIFTLLNVPFNVCLN